MLTLLMCTSTPSHTWCTVCTSSHAECICKIFFTFLYFLFLAYSQRHSASPLFCLFGCCRSPPLHVTSIRKTLEPVVLVGLGSPLLHRNRRTWRRWSPEKVYQKPAHPGPRSISCSYKYTYTVCLILSCSLRCLCHCSCPSVWICVRHSRIQNCPSL